MSNNTRPKKRDKLLGLFTRDGGAAAATHPGAAPTSGPAQPNITSSLATPPRNAFRPYDTFVAAALDRLSDADRAVVEEYFGASNINETVRSAYNGANELKTKLEDTKGPVGQKIDKVLILIDKFKAIGDGVTNLDPIHASLPWAGVKILLSVAVADIKQREALVTGMDLALGMSNRLHAYFLYFQRLPPHLTTENLRKALIEVYAQVLKFLAQAFRVYKTNAVLRGVRTLWQDTTIQDFEKVCDKFSDRLEIEASNCDRNITEAGRIEAVQWRNDLAGELKKLDELSHIESKLQNLNINVDLSKLTVVASATFNSSEESQQPSCLPDTRVDILNRILLWAESQDSKSIYWLCGGAGTGKSTISRTVAQMLHDKQQLGASFFFKRSHAGRGNADRFFPTVVRQLADRIPALKQPVSDALNEDSFLCSNSLADQFNKLLKEPLMSLDKSSLPRKRIVIVIDALDECDRRHIKKVLPLLASLNVIDDLQLRIFVTSRPELPIEIDFEKIDGRLHDDYVLETAQAASIEDDLKKYLVHEFTEIRREWPYDPLPDNWPSQEDIATLVALAKPLFIYAATVCRFVAEESPRKRLDGILTNKHAVSSLRLDGDATHLQLIYSQVLDEATKSIDADETSARIQAFKAVVGPIMLAADPLSVKTLSEILAIDEDDINVVLKPLKSVLDVPRDLSLPIQRRHLSFREYLLDPKNKANEAFRIDKSQTHARLATRCIRLLMDSDMLKQDICTVGKPGFNRFTMSESDIAQKIPRDIAYACIFWAHHLVASGGLLVQGVESTEISTQHDQLYNFLAKHFLHWLEVIAWLGGYTLAVSSISDLIEILKHSDDMAPSPTASSNVGGQEDVSNKLAMFLEDARRFVLKFRPAIETAPLQVYHSAIRFAPTESLIATMFTAEMPDLWDLFPIVPPRWGEDLLALEGCESVVYDIVFSPNGRVFASASYDERVRLWSTTGELLHIIKHDDFVDALAFVAEGEHLASVTCLGQFQLWNVNSGERVRNSLIDKMPSDLGHNLVVIGPRMIWAGENGTLWSYDHNSEQRQLLWTLNEGYTTFLEQSDSRVADRGKQRCLTVSADGLDCREESGQGPEEEDDHLSHTDEDDGSRSLNGLEHEPLKFTAIAISPTGKIAAGTSHGDLLIWNSSSDTKPYTKHCHDAAILAIALSAGEDFVTSGDDRMVRVWTWSKDQALIRCERDVFRAKSLALTSDGVLAYDSGRSVVLWETHSGKTPQKLQGHTEIIEVVAFSSDGQLATAGFDGTIRLWTKTRRDRKTVEVPEVYHSRVLIISTVPGGDIVASGDLDGDVRIWHAQSGKELKVLQGHSDVDARVVAISPDESIVAAASMQSLLSVGGEQNNVTWWDVNDHKKRGPVPSGFGHPVVPAFSPDSKTIAFVSQDRPGGKKRSLQLWDVREGEKVCEYLWQDVSTVQSLSFSPDGRFLISGHDAGYAQVWDARQCSNALLRIDCDLHTVDSVAMSSKHVVATAWSEKWPIKLWDVNSGRLLSTFYVDEDAPPPGQLEFSPDGDFLRSAAGIFELFDDFSSSRDLPKFRPHVLRLNRAGDWMQRNGENILWIPSEARLYGGERGPWLVTPDETVAIGTSDRGVLFFRLK